jgi:EAL and modified HD-GYP domain-containing signal transduction protein
MFDAKMAVEGYYFVARKANNLLLNAQSSKVLDGVLSSRALDVINSVGISALTGDKPVFVPINPLALLVNIEDQCNESPEKIIFVLDSTIEPEEMYINKISAMLNKGYTFALRHVKNFDYYAKLLPYMQYLFLDSRNTDLRASQLYLKANYPNLQLVVSKIEDSQKFDEVKYGKFDLFEGKFYRLPLSKGSYAVSPLKVNYIQLLNIVNDENFELNEVADVVQQDTALAISLLRMVNKFGLASEVKSINHAAAMIGQSELRRWITTAVADKLYADKPNEITRLSLLRAKFAENLAPFFEMAILSKELYLMGLFSVLDIILEMPISEALSLVKVSDTIRAALVENKGRYVEVLNFIKAYESADWQDVARMVILHNIDENKLYNAFIESALWYSKLISV